MNFDFKQLKCQFGSVCNVSLNLTNNDKIDLLCDGGVIDKLIKLLISF